MTINITVIVECDNCNAFEVYQVNETEPPLITKFMSELKAKGWKKGMYEDATKFDVCPGCVKLLGVKLKKVQ